MAVEKCCKKAASASEPKQPEREGLGPSTHCFYLSTFTPDEEEKNRGRGSSRLQSQVQASLLGEGGAFLPPFIPLCHFWLYLTCIFSFFYLRESHIAEIAVTFSEESCKLNFYFRSIVFLPSLRTEDEPFEFPLISSPAHQFPDDSFWGSEQHFVRGKSPFYVWGKICFGSSYQLCVNVHVPFLRSLC